MTIIVLILILYMGGMLAIGFLGRNSSSSMTEFLTAGRSGGLFVMVCTYIGAPVGRTMPGMNNQEAQVFVLKR